MEYILYGVGKALLKDFVDPTKIVAFTKLKDLAINVSGNEEPVTGGDNPYPLTSFPKDKAIKVSATNATLTLGMVNATQGTTLSKAVVNFHEVIDGIIPADGVVTLEHTPVVDSAVIEGFTETETTAATGQYVVDETGKTITFAVADAGKSFVGFYKWASSSNAETMSVLKTSVAKPFEFVHRIPIYDENSQIVAQGQLVVYKAKATNAFDFGLAPGTAFAPKLELDAQDPRRPDGKLWDFTIDPVTA